MVKGLDSHRNAHQVLDDLPYRPASGAASDDEGVFGGHVGDLLGFAGIRVAAGLEQADALRALAIQASSGQPTPTFAPMAIARSAIENLATSYWLVEEGIDTPTRVARVLTLRLQELKGHERLHDIDHGERIEELKRTANALGLRVKGRGNRQGIGNLTPSRSAMVGSLLGEGQSYVLLSAVTHGESWALIFFGFALTGTRTSYGEVLLKDPPVAGLGFAVLKTLTAIEKLAAVETRYRGWDVDRLAGVIRETDQTINHP